MWILRSEIVPIICSAGLESQSFLECLNSPGSKNQNKTKKVGMLHEIWIKKNEQNSFTKCSWARVAHPAYKQGLSVSSSMFMSDWAFQTHSWYYHLFTWATIQAGAPQLLQSFVAYFPACLKCDADIKLRNIIYLWVSARSMRQNMK